MATKKRRAPKTAYVPRVVFTVAVAAVVPALVPTSCGGGPSGVACSSFCGVAAVAMGGFGGVAAVAMGGFGGVGGSGGTGGTTPTGTGGSGGTATGTGGNAGAGGTASLVMPADPRAADSPGDAAPAKKSSRAARTGSRRRG